MGFFDTVIDGAKASALEAAHSYGTEAVNKVTGTSVAAPTQNEAATNIPPSGQVSPRDATASYFTPSGFIAWVKANPVKGIAAVLVLGGVALWAVRKFKK